MCHSRVSVVCHKLVFYTEKSKPRIVAHDSLGTSFLIPKISAKLTNKITPMETPNARVVG